MRYLLIISGLLFWGTTFSQEMHDLKVIIKNFESAKGSVRIELYSGKENYMKAAVAGRDTLVYDKQAVEITFREVPAGNYAFSLYHDENGNGDLDKGLFGIPTEDYAFSNNANGRYGPPAYEECAFDLTSSTTQIITINQ